jgi:hypothetical protein
LRIVLIILKRSRSSKITFSNSIFAFLASATSLMASRKISGFSSSKAAIR